MLYMLTYCQIPKETFPTLVEYIASLRGVARKLTLANAKQRLAAGKLEDELEALAVAVLARDRGAKLQPEGAEGEKRAGLTPAQRDTLQAIQKKRASTITSVLSV